MTRQARQRGHCKSKGEPGSRTSLEWGQEPPASHSSSGPLGTGSRLRPRAAGSRHLNGLPRHWRGVGWERRQQIGPHQPGKQKPSQHPAAYLWSCNPSSHRGGWRGQLGQARSAAWLRALIFMHSHPRPQPGTTRMSIRTLTEGGAGKL